MYVALDSFGDILKTTDLCKLLDLSECHVRKMLSSGQLPGVKIGGRWYVPKSELENFLTDKLEVAHVQRK